MTATATDIVAALTIAIARARLNAVIAVCEGDNGLAAAAAALEAGAIDAYLSVIDTPAGIQLARSECAACVGAELDAIVDIFSRHMGGREVAAA